MARCKIRRLSRLVLINAQSAAIKKINEMGFILSFKPSTITPTISPVSAICPARNSLQILITQRKSLVGLIPEPIPLAHIKPSFLLHRHSGVKSCSTLELLLKRFIFLDLGKQAYKL